MKDPEGQKLRVGRKLGEPSREGDRRPAPPDCPGRWVLGVCVSLCEGAPPRGSGKVSFLSHLLPLLARWLLPAGETDLPPALPGSLPGAGLATPSGEERSLSPRPSVSGAAGQPGWGVRQAWV